MFDYVRAHRMPPRIAPLESSNMIAMDVKLKGLKRLKKNDCPRCKIKGIDKIEKNMNMTSGWLADDTYCKTGKSDSAFE